MFRRPALVLIAFFFLWLVLLLSLVRPPYFLFLTDPGTFWHTVVGEHITSTGRLPYTDTFSFTFFGRPWIAQQWLAECVMAWLYGVGRLDGLVLAAAVLLAGLYTWLGGRFLDHGLHWLPTAVLVFLTIVASWYHFHARPHLASIVLLAWTFAQLIDYEAGRVASRSLWWLVPVFALWTNLHGGMLGGTLTLGLVVVGWTGYRILGWPAPIASRRNWLFVVSLVLLCALTALLNPYGTRLLHVWFYLSGSNLLPEYISEHKPLDPTDRGDRFVLVLAAIYVFQLLSTWPHRPRVVWLVPLVWLYFASQRIRHGPLFSVTASLAMADMLPFTLWARWLKDRGSFFFTPTGPSPQPPPPTWLGVALLVLGGGLALQAFSCPVPLLGAGWAELPAIWWPTDHLDDLQHYVASERLAGRQPRIFNDMLFGGYLIRFVPELPVFIDDRCELYGDDFLRQFLEAEASDPAQAGRWVEQYGIGLALLPQASGYNRYFDSAPGWERHQARPYGPILYRRRAMSAEGHRRDE
ncbi:MAG: hypothetical protein NZ700_11900 [Gemmataceae bacterium]|nr:hypothetical protein [Gemmataceae bacterium]MDW8265964.1 hypothetical protein [Gemmataceae bacterium]